MLEVSGGEVRLLGCPGPPDPLGDVQTAAGACLGGWAEVMAVEGTRLWLELVSSWEEVWRLEAALEKVFGAGREPGLALRPEEVEAGRGLPPPARCRLAPGPHAPPPPVRGRGRLPAGLRRSGEGRPASCASAPSSAGWLLWRSGWWRAHQPRPCRSPMYGSAGARRSRW